MINETFDGRTAAIINPDIYSTGVKACDTVVLTFSHRIIDRAAQLPDVRLLVRHECLNFEQPIYIKHHQGHDIGFLMLTIGAPAAVIALEEGAMITGAHRFVMFGSCGCLDQTIADGTIIVPDRAWRDEGTSYLYAPACDWIDIPKAPAVAGFMSEHGVPVVQGATWTTDAIYRETRGTMALRKASGCIAADMEVAALQAACRWRGYSYYPFMYGADQLDSSLWDKRSLGEACEHDHALTAFELAMDLAASLEEKGDD